jgi:hypothetical protein
MLSFQLYHHKSSKLHPVEMLGTCGMPQQPPLYFLVPSLDSTLIDSIAGTLLWFSVWPMSLVLAPQTAGVQCHPITDPCLQPQKKLPAVSPIPGLKQSTAPLKLYSTPAAWAKPDSNHKSSSPPLLLLPVLLLVLLLPALLLSVLLFVLLVVVLPVLLDVLSVLLLLVLLLRVGC